MELLRSIRQLLFIQAFIILFFPVFSQRPLKNPAVVWEDMPYIRSGVQLWSHTSKSPLNRTVQDFLNYTTADVSGYELANFKGRSGMFVQGWFAFLSADSTGSLKLFDTQNKSPLYNQPFKNYFNTGKYPHLLWESKDAIWWSFPCVPFTGGFKATTDIKPQWYQLTLQTYREKRFSEFITQHELELIDKKMHRPTGTFPGAEPGKKHESATTSLSATETVTVFSSSDAGVIRQLHLLPQGNSISLLDSIYIRITTDNEQTAYLPVSFFFGGFSHVNMKNARGLPAGFDGKTLYNYFPMPYWKAFKIELENKTNRTAIMSYRIDWSDDNPYAQNKTGVFKVQYNAPTPVKAGEPDFINLSVEGSGLMVGAVSQLTGAIEANFSIHVDGLKTSAIESTGGEDYFIHSYGIHPGFARPFSGGLGDTMGYRFHIIDYVPFLESLTFTQDHALYQTHDRNGIFNSAVFYYHNPKKYLVVTDSLDVGDKPSEMVHDYRIKGTRMLLQKDTASYEGNYTTAIADQGRWTNGYSGFTFLINPENDGVRLRKRINQTAYHQEVKVYVDNVFVGTWFEQGTNYNLNKRMYYNDSLPNWEKGNIEAKFRDTEFEIPASFTSGKSSITVRMQTVGSLAVFSWNRGLTNEYYYWAYSYLPF
ncbi:MAG: DUF2961 domain-containing protein [Chitinophagaceae bacterium]